MTGKKLIDLIIAGVSILSTLAVLGVFYYTEKMFVKPPIDESKEQAELLASVDPKALPELYKMDKMIISLLPTDDSRLYRLRFLEIEIHLVLFKKEDIELIKAQLPLIQDRAIDIAQKMTPDDLNTLSGKMLFENRIKNETNQLLGQSVIRSLYFSRYIVQ